MWSSYSNLTPEQKRTYQLRNALLTFSGYADIAFVRQQVAQFSALGLHLFEPHFTSHRDSNEPDVSFIAKSISDNLSRSMRPSENCVWESNQHLIGQFATLCRYYSNAHAEGNFGWLAIEHLATNPHMNVQDIPTFNRCHPWMNKATPLLNALILSDQPWLALKLCLMHPDVSSDSLLMRQTPRALTPFTLLLAQYIEDESVREWSRTPVASSNELKNLCPKAPLTAEEMDHLYEQAFFALCPDLANNTTPAEAKKKTKKSHAHLETEEHDKEHVRSFFVYAMDTLTDIGFRQIERQSPQVSSRILNETATYCLDMALSHQCKIETLAPQLVKVLCHPSFVAAPKTIELLEQSFFIYPELTEAYEKNLKKSTGAELVVKGLPTLFNYLNDGHQVDKKRLGQHIARFIKERPIEFSKDPDLSHCLQAMAHTAQFLGPTTKEFSSAFNPLSAALCALPKVPQPSAPFAAQYARMFLDALPLTHKLVEFISQILREPDHVQFHAMAKKLLSEPNNSLALHAKFIAKHVSGSIPGLDTFDSELPLWSQRMATKIGLSEPIARLIILDAFVASINTSFLGPQEEEKKTKQTSKNKVNPFLKITPPVQAYVYFHVQHALSQIGLSNGEFSPVVDSMSQLASQLEGQFKKNGIMTPAFAALVEKNILDIQIALHAPESMVRVPKKVLRA